MFAWFNTKAVDEFAARLVADFAIRYPMMLDGGKGTSAPSRLEQALLELYARAEKFHLQERLGLYKKAKLANAVKWHLKELGYDGELVDRVTENLAMRLASKRPKSKKNA